MPKSMQIEALKRIFKSLNPEVGVDMVDWSAHIEESLTLPENRLELSIAYPSYLWFADEGEMKDVKREALRETEELLDYMLSALPEEMKPGYKIIFDDYLSRMRYSLERKITTAPLKKKIVEQGKIIEELQREARRAGKPEPTRKEIEERVKIPPTPRPPAWTTSLQRKLEDKFKATFTREGLSPTKYMSEYRDELEIIRALSTEEEMVAAVEGLAAEIVRRELGRKIRPPRLREERPPPEKPPREVRIGLPPKEEEEEEEEFFITAPPAAFPVYPEKPFKTELYPNRNLTSSEIDDIWDVFTEAVYMCGKKPDRYLKEFNAWIENFLFDSWEQVKSNYADLIDNVCYEKKIALVPRAPPAEVLDELIHWITSIATIKDVVDNKKILRTPETIEEVIDKLEEMGKPGVPKSDVIAAVKRGWKEKAPNYVIVEKAYLEKLIGEPLE